MDFCISDNGYSIRPAALADGAALGMLLPGMNAAAEAFVAVDGRHQLVIGAAMAAREHRRQPLAGPGVAVHVIEPCRRHGIGTALIARLAVAAGSAGATALYGAKRVELDGEDMGGWKRLGFQACATVQQHRLPVAQLQEQLTPLVERIRRRGSIPSTAQIIPLYRADLPAVLQLHLDNLGGDRDELHRRLHNRGPHPFLPQYSRVLVVDNQVRGCILAHRKNAETITVDAHIVDPSIRAGGWANAWLKLEGMRVTAFLGLKYFEFTTFDHYGDTRRFTTKVGGVTTGTSVLMYRPLGRDAKR